MPITDPITITHNAKQRNVDTQGFAFKTPTGGDISIFVEALTWLDGGTELDAAPTQLKRAGKGASFSQEEIVAAYQAQATTMGLNMSPAEVGEFIAGGVNQLIRNRYED